MPSLFFGLYGLLQIEDWLRFGGDAPGFQMFLHVIPLQTQGIVFAVWSGSSWGRAEVVGKFSSSLLGGECLVDGAPAFFPRTPDKDELPSASFKNADPTP